jgi:hypothetical protein
LVLVAARVAQIVAVTATVSTVIAAAVTEFY